MYKHIMIPVDLAHKDGLRRTMSVAADLARHYGAKMTFVGVTANTPGPVAHNPKEYEAKLGELAAGYAESHSVEATGHAVVSHDPTADLDAKLIEARQAIEADLVVMATHVPNIADMLVPGHGGELARHAKVSVFLVRGTD